LFFQNLPNLKTIGCNQRHRNISLNSINTCPRVTMVRSLLQYLNVAHKNQSHLKVAGTEGRAVGAAATVSGSTVGEESEGTGS